MNPEKAIKIDRRYVEYFCCRRLSCSLLLSLCTDGLTAKFGRNPLGGWKMSRWLEDIRSDRTPPSVHYQALTLSSNHSALTHSSNHNESLIQAPEDALQALFTNKHHGIQPKRHDVAQRQYVYFISSRFHELIPP